MHLQDQDTVRGWITLKRYCEVSGDSRQAVHLRVRAGKWQRGVHFTVPDGSGAWVNIPAVINWLREGLDLPALLDTAAGEIAVPPPAMEEPVAVVVEAKPTYTVYVPELMQDDETAAPVFANLTGMDMSGTVLGPHTKMAGRARQFDTAELCQDWCDTQNEMYVPKKVTLEYV